MKIQCIFHIVRIKCSSYHLLASLGALALKSYSGCKSDCQVKKWQLYGRSVWMRCRIENSISPYERASKNRRKWPHEYFPPHRIRPLFKDLFIVQYFYTVQLYKMRKMHFWPSKQLPTVFLMVSTAKNRIFHVPYAILIVCQTSGSIIF